MTEVLHSDEELAAHIAEIHADATLKELRKTNELLAKLLAEMVRNTSRTSRYPSGGGPH